MGGTGPRTQDARVLVDHFCSLRRRILGEPRAWSTDTTLLLGLDGVSVIRVESLADGTRRVHLIAADEAARACPSCGVIASRVTGLAVTRPRDLPYGERRLEFFWHKRRWWCRESKCPRKSFTESIAQIPAGARVTARRREAAGNGCAMPTRRSDRPPATCICPGRR
ncbi:transposase family protein [Streptomyces griseorubiginosus]|uniref:transposase family protein n=1 Tax=Streptomyces griseorubiginosus TaxID=67304 RepID=UPI0033AA33D1